MSLDLTRQIAYLITSGECEASNFSEAGDRVIETIVAALDAGVGLIQIREKLLPANLVTQLAFRAVEVTRTSPTKLLINDRVDIAIAVGADGVHLTSASLPVQVIRESCPDDLIVGVSVHTTEEVHAAAAEGADFALFGPVFQSPGKGDGVGIEVLRTVCSSVPNMPVIAVGGIDETNVDAVLEVGAAGFASIRSLNDPDKMRSMMRRIQP